MPNPGDEHAAGDVPEEMTPDTRPLSQQMSLDGMYSGIVEKWAAEVAGLEARIEALEAEVERLLESQSIQEEPKGGLK